MISGDLVRYVWPTCLGRLDDHAYTIHDKQIGIVIDVKAWKDSGAPDRNFGVSVVVQWADSSINDYEEDELEVISELA